MNAQVAENRENPGGQWVVQGAQPSLMGRTPDISRAGRIRLLSAPVQRYMLKCCPLTSGKDKLDGTHVDRTIESR